MLYTFKLDLVNRHDKLIWIVIPRHDHSVPKDGRFVAETDGGLSFGPSVLSLADRELHDWSSGKSFGIQCYDGPRFFAIRLPARGELHIDDWGTGEFTPVREYEFWEASAILVDGKTPLQDWVAGRVMSPHGNYVTPTDANRDPALPGEILMEAADEPVDRVTSVEFEQLRRWKVPILEIERASKGSRP